MWKNRTLKFLIRHIARHDLVVVRHPLDHEILDQLPNPQLELVQWIGQRRLNHLIVLAGFFFDLLEKEPVFFGKLCAEALVQHLDDLRQRRFPILGLAGADVDEAFDVLPSGVFSPV